MTPVKKFESLFRGKSVAVVGIGISNTPLVKMLLLCGARVTARDKNPVGCEEELRQLGAVVLIGDGYLDGLTEEIIIKTPGMRYDLPELLKASKNGSIITTEMELFYFLCPTVHTIGITGSDGKTTTSTVISLLLQQAGKKVWLGGNIGKPLLPELANIKKQDFVVTELSSFQLQTMKISPKTAVVTNISPNHLDMHKDYEEYINAKRNIYLYQKRNDRLILNSGNEITNGFLKTAKAKIYDFSANQKTKQGIFLENGCLYLAEKGKIERLLDIKDITVPGKHNIENFMAAILAVKDYVTPEDIKIVAREFKGVPHRISFIRELDGVRYYNSSIDSSPSRTIATLSVFDKNVLLIAGGKDKNLEFEPLGKAILEKVKVLILTGETAGKIEQALIAECQRQKIENPIKIIFCKTYEEIAVTAKKEAVSGDTVLLSPAGTSFDQFKNFEERGQLFTELVLKL